MPLDPYASAGRDSIAQTLMGISSPPPQTPLPNMPGYRPQMQLPQTPVPGAPPQGAPVPQQGPVQMPLSAGVPPNPMQAATGSPTPGAPMAPMQQATGQMPQQPGY